MKNNFPQRNPLRVIGEVAQLCRPWEELLEASFLSTVMKEKNDYIG